MNRRGFLTRLTAGLAGAAATMVLDPERLLWRPGAKTFFIPEKPAIRVTEWQRMMQAQQALNAQWSQLHEWHRGPVDLNAITTIALKTMEQELQTPWQESFREVNAPSFRMIRASRLSYPPLRLGPDLNPIPSPVCLDVETYLPTDLRYTVTQEAMRKDPIGMAIQIGEDFARHLKGKIVATQRLEPHRHVDASAVVRSPRSGLSLRGTSAYDIMADQVNHQFDLRVFLRDA